MLSFKFVPFVHPCSPRIVGLLEGFSRDVFRVTEVIDGSRCLVADDDIGSDAVPVFVEGQ